MMLGTDFQRTRMHFSRRTMRARRIGFIQIIPFSAALTFWRRGTSLFREGDLSKAVLVLEAAVQAQPDDTIAWQTLGQAHADADDDARAIPCLRRAVAADPHNLDALLALGVSYTNELDQSRALRHLQLWLESHPDFIDIPDSP